MMMLSIITIGLSFFWLLIETKFFTVRLAVQSIYSTIDMIVAITPTILFLAAFVSLFGNHEDNQIIMPKKKESLFSRLLDAINQFFIDIFMFLRELLNY